MSFKKYPSLILLCLGLSCLGAQGNESTKIDTVPVEVATFPKRKIAVGYMSIEQEQLTTAVGSLSASHFNVGNINDPLLLAQGRVAGLLISKAGGNPNSLADVRIRGLSSLSTNNAPMIVIDGVIGADLKLVDPNDIASFDVLKDAAATAIYGVQGAAGVILIRTKSGDFSSPNRLSYSNYLAIDQLGAFHEVADSRTYLRLLGDVAGEAVRDNNNYGLSTNWAEELTRTASSHVHSLNYKGGSTTTAYSASLNYRDIEGIGIANDGFEQLNARISLSQLALNNRLKVGLNLAATDREAAYFDLATFQYALSFNPSAPARVDQPGGNIPPFVTDIGNTIYGGYFELNNFDYFNPVAIAQTSQSTGEERFLLYNFDAELAVLDNLFVSAKYASSQSTLVLNSFASRTSRFAGNASGNEETKGTAGRLLNNLRDEQFQLMSRYEAKFGKSHLQFQAGVVSQVIEGDGLSAFGIGLPSDAFGYNNLGTLGSIPRGQIALNSYRFKNKLLGTFARARLSFDDTYELLASVRRDGTSTFNLVDQFDVYPAISGSANLANVLRLQNFDQLKLRLGYSATGQLAESSYVANSIGYIGANTIILPNGSAVLIPLPPVLVNERTLGFNLGFDVQTSNQKLSASLDYFNNNTINPIVMAQLPIGGQGVPVNSTNVDLVNSGLELMLGLQVLNKDKFKWQANVIGFSARSRLVLKEGAGLFNSPSPIGIRSSSPVFPGAGDNDPTVFIGTEDPLGSLYALEVDLERSRQQNNWVYIDNNRDGIITPADKQLLGNGLPSFSLGFSNNWQIGKFDASILFRGDFGHSLVNTSNYIYGQMGNLRFRSIDNLVVSDRFEESILDGNRGISSHFVEKASFLALDNAQLAYTFCNKKATQQRSLRLYLAAQNLFYITNYSGPDPNVRLGDNGSQLVNGIDRLRTYPRLRTFLFGLQLQL